MANPGGRGVGGHGMGGWVQRSGQWVGKDVNSIRNSP